jgi:putative ABC transport system permease protein
MRDFKEELRKRLSQLRLAPAREADIVEELAQHLDDQYEGLVESGATEEEAYGEVLRGLSEGDLLAQELGQVERPVRQETVVLGAERRMSVFRDFWQDVRFGVRMLLKKPGFTAVAVIALALGIGATTSIFSVVNAVLLRSLSFPDSERLMIVRETNLARGIADGGASMPDFREWRTRNQVFEQLAAFSADNFNISGNEEPERVSGAVVSADLFNVLGISPAQGRAFLQEEEQFGRHRVAIVSDELWRKRFGAAARLSDQTIKLNGEVFAIVGVMPREFEFPERATTLWIPLSLPEKSPYNTRGNYWLGVIGRLKPGVSQAQAQANMNEIHRQLEQEIKETAGFGALLISLQESLVGDVQTALLILLGAVGFVLLIACANVANLLLARAASRQKEIAVRTALGASRQRIVRQLLTESMMLGLLGGACGLLLAVWGVSLLVGLEPELPRINEINVDARVLVFTLVLALLTSLVFGLMPAIQASKSDLNESLKEGGRSATGGERSQRARKALVVAEIALSLVLLVGAGLMVNSLLRLQKVNPGFRTDHILTMQLSLPEAKYPSDRPELTTGFYQQLIERVRTLPGVQSVGVTSSLPLTNSGWGKLLTLEDRAIPTSLQDVPVVQYRHVSPEYFKTLGIPLLEGRSLSERDTRDTLPVAVINETMARRYWPDGNPLGKRLYLGPPEELLPPGALPPDYRFIRWTVVGIIGDVRQRGLNEPLGPEIYTLPEQSLTNDSPVRSMYLAVHTATEPTGLTAAIRRQVEELDKEQPTAEVATMEKLLSDSLSRTRFSTLLMGIFAVVSLVLAGVGVYGVMSYMVTQRTHEIGIRMALGAQKGDVLKLIVGQGMMMALIGTVIGLAGAFAVTRLMASLLFGVSATDPATFVVISLLLIAVALLACYLPARRAMKVDPMIALRYE